MSWKTVCVCDVCGAHKGEANHWLLAWVFPLEGAAFFGAARWEDSAWARDGMFHLCGHACLQKRLGEHLARPDSPQAAAVPARFDPDPEPTERTYEPVRPAQEYCEYCGPECEMGDTHNLRAERGMKLRRGGRP